MGQSQVSWRGSKTCRAQESGGHLQPWLHTPGLWASLAVRPARSCWAQCLYRGEEPGLGSLSPGPDPSRPWGRLCANPCVGHGQGWARCRNCGGCQSRRAVGGRGTEGCRRDCARGMLAWPTSSCSCSSCAGAEAEDQEVPQAKLCSLGSCPEHHNRQSTLLVCPRPAGRVARAQPLAAAPTAPAPVHLPLPTCHHPRAASSSVPLPTLQGPVMQQELAQPHSRCPAPGPPLLPAKHHIHLQEGQERGSGE